MSLLSKYTNAQVYACGALLLFLLGLSIWFTIWYLVDENQELSQENVVAVADAASEAEHGTGLVKNEREYSNIKDKAHEALKDNPQYRDAPVPEPVADLLRDPTRPTK